MDKKAMKESLWGLAEGADGRSDSALVGELLGEIDAAMARGVRREVILASLRQHGVSLTLQGFQTALRRKRKERATREAKGTSSNKNLPTMSAQQKEAPKPTAVNSQTVLSSARPTASSPKLEPNLPEQKSKLEEEEDKAFDEHQKSIAHLSAVQRGKQTADFLEKQAENRMSPTARKLFGES
jgi:hypothetical protein